MTKELPKFVHDTKRIVSVNAAGCELFRCPESALVDLDMMDLILHEDFKGLAKLRMVMMRTRKRLPPIRYYFLRCDGTAFYGAVTTEHLEDGTFETTVIYEGEK